jgi:NAD(P)-dependent dehydrogenase (short-subunit alcohol dehydrogenase family)
LKNSLSLLIDTKIDLTGQVVLIAGGTRGIGVTTALIFAEAGEKVAILYRSIEKR